MRLKISFSVFTITNTTRQRGMSTVYTFTSSTECHWQVRASGSANTHHRLLFLSVWIVVDSDRTFQYITLHLNQNGCTKCCIAANYTCTSFLALLGQSNLQFWSTKLSLTHTTHPLTLLCRRRLFLTRMLHHFLSNLKQMRRMHLNGLLLSRHRWVETFHRHSFSLKCRHITPERTLTNPSLSPSLFSPHTLLPVPLDHPLGLAVRCASQSSCQHSTRWKPRTWIFRHTVCGTQTLTLTLVKCAQFAHSLVLLWCSKTLEISYTSLC